LASGASKKFWIHSAECSQWGQWVSIRKTEGLTSV